MLDKRSQLTAMPTPDHRDRRVVFQTHCFDVEERCLLQKVGHDPPAVEGGGDPAGQGSVLGYNRGGLAVLDPVAIPVTITAG